MCLNRNKSDEILLQLVLKVFSANTIRGQERENMKKIGTQYNKHYQFIICANENYKE